MDVSPFVGSWSGRWQSQSGHEGHWQLTIADNGSLTGTSVDETMKSEGPIKGRMEANNTLTYEYRYAKIFYAGRGTLSQGADDTLTLIYEDFQNGVRSSRGQSTLTRTVVEAVETVEVAKK